MAGHGCLHTSSPTDPRSECPSASNTSTSIPSDAPPSEHGLIGSTGNGERKAPPTSVPPEKLITGRRFRPTDWASHSYAAASHGSPEAPNTRSELMSMLESGGDPAALSARMSVGET